MTLLLRCEDAYQPEEVDEMMGLGMEVASYKCFQKIFNRLTTFLAERQLTRKLILIFQVLQGLCQGPYSRLL